MAQSGLKIKVDTETYTLDFNKVNLGEARILKEKYNLPNFADFSIWDPDHLVGVLYVAVKREHPELDDDEILAKVNLVENGPIFDELEKQAKKARKPAADPRKPGAKGSTAPAAGSSGTTPNRSGSQSTSASMA